MSDQEDPKTTLSLGEEDPPFTTLALGEEDKPKTEVISSPTTMATGEEGGGGPTTMATGEEESAQAGAGDGGSPFGAF
ncbi:MAG: hypothetical protein ACJ75H_17860 [Thermoanaerobaculia bacterium]